MTYEKSAKKYTDILNSIRDDGLYKDELLISSQQTADIKASEQGGDVREVIISVQTITWDSRTIQN